MCHMVYYVLSFYVFCQAEDGIRDLVRSRGLGDVYKRQGFFVREGEVYDPNGHLFRMRGLNHTHWWGSQDSNCLLYTSDAADERSSVDLGGRRIIKKKTERQGSRRLSNKQKMR